MVLRDLSSYVVGLLAGEYPQDEVEILQSASRHKRAPAVTSKHEVDRLRQEMEGLRLRASTAETRVAELEGEVERLRSTREAGLTRGGSLRVEEVGSQATGDTSSQPAPRESAEEAIKRLRGKRDHLRHKVASLPPLSQEQADAYTGAAQRLMATTQDHITELNLWRAQYTGSAAAVITDLRQTVERYREVVGEVGPKPRGSPPREREKEHIPKATAVPGGTQHGEEDTRQGGGHPRGHGTPAVPSQKTSAAPPKDEAASRLAED